MKADAKRPASNETMRRWWRRPLMQKTTRWHIPPARLFVTGSGSELLMTLTADVVPVSKDVPLPFRLWVRQCRFRPHAYRQILSAARKLQASEMVTFLRSSVMEYGMRRYGAGRHRRSLRSITSLRCPDGDSISIYDLDLRNSPSFLAARYLAHVRQSRRELPFFQKPGEGWSI